MQNGDAYGYGVLESGWKDGKGDLVQEFVTQARKHGLTPGIYYSLASNFYLSIGSNTTAGALPVPPTTKGQRPCNREEYYDIVYTQVEELWGKYGELGELWFDGKFPFGGDPALKARIAEITARLQPHAILLDGPSSRNGARKGNGETCTVHDPNWMTCPSTNACRGKNATGGTGAFLPSEGEGCAVGDGNSRQWFWHPDHDAHAALKTVDMFVDEYHNSVGLGSNMLVGFTADRRGLVPENDVAKVTQVGDFLRRCYGTPLARSAEPTALHAPADYIDLEMPSGASTDRVWLREDISTGQRAQAFKVFTLATRQAEPQLVFTGSSVARKRIVLLNATVAVQVVRFQVTEALEWPVPISEVAAFAPCGKP